MGPPALVRPASPLSSNGIASSGPSTNGSKRFLFQPVPGVDSIELPMPFVIFPSSTAPSRDSYHPPAPKKHEIPAFRGVDNGLENGCLSSFRRSGSAENTVGDTSSQERPSSRIVRSTSSLRRHRLEAPRRRSARASGRNACPRKGGNGNRFSENPMLSKGIEQNTRFSLFRILLYARPVPAARNPNTGRRGSGRPSGDRRSRR